jgi:hypothetical protein
MAKTKISGEYLKDSVVRFTAKAGENITKGQAVYISGISGEVPVVSLADADDTNKMPAFGLAESTVSTNGSIEVTSNGTLAGIDTSSYALGDILYISTTAGSLTNDPSGLEASKVQNIGMVQRVHASNGSIKVGGAGRTNATPNLNDGNIFVGNSSNKSVSDAFTDVLNDQAGINANGSSVDVTGTLTADTIASVGGTTNNRGIILSHQNNTNQSYVGRSENGAADTSNRITFDYDNDKMQLDSDGDIVLTPTSNVGIGNTSPANKLAVNGGLSVEGAAAAGISEGLLIDYSTNLARFLTYDSSTGSEIAFYTQPSGGSTAERVRINSSGNVGIGVSPSDILHIFKSTYPIFKIQSSSYVSTLGIDTGDGTTVLANESNSNLAFKTNNTERMRIDSSGNLLVGTTDVNPSDNGASGDAGHAIAASGYLASARSDDTVALFNRMDSDGDVVDFRKNGTIIGSIGTINSTLVIGSGDTGLLFSSGDDVIIPRNSSTAARDAAIDLGDATNRFKDLYLSGGAYIGGTGSANKLDDYEEGTWTPSYQDSSGNAITNQVNQQGSYTKVGSLVYIQGCLRTQSSSSTSGVSGNLQIAGLPFTSANVLSTGHVVFHTHETSSSYNAPNELPRASSVGANATVINLYKYSGSGGRTTLFQVSDLNMSGNSNFIFFAGTYRID